MELGLLTKSAAAMVYDVASPLPEVLSSEEDDDDEDHLLSQLQTPPSSQQGQESNGKRPRRDPPARSQPTRKTPRRRSQMPSASQGQSRVTDFFSHTIILFTHVLQLAISVIMS